MAETPAEFHARIAAAADADGRLTDPDYAGWAEVFPFELDGLRVVPFRPPAEEPAREGAGGVDCRICAGDDAVWRDDEWRLWTFGETTSVLTLMLAPLRHCDYTDLSDDEAGQLGRLCVHIARAIESIPYLERAHVGRWGEGAEHLHIWFFARPSGQLQLRGSFLTAWTDVLPMLPDHIRRADAARVGELVAHSYGGRAVQSA